MNPHLTAVRILCTDSIENLMQQSIRFPPPSKTTYPNHKKINPKFFIMKTKHIPINLSHTDWNGRETHLQNTANCYIIRNEGTYQIPLVYGNAIKDGKVNTEAFYTKGIATEFEDSYGIPFTASSSPFIRDHAAAQDKFVASAEILWNDGESKINILSVDNDFLTFDVQSFSLCNALVAVKDNDGTILWSWHLWLTNEDLTPKTITNAEGIDFKVMPCNLGWNGWTADGKPTSPYYQWGRKDPFIANGSVTYKAISSTQKQHIAHQNPKDFYYCNRSYSWTTDKYKYFWDSKMNGHSVNQKVTKTIYDPCPTGWCIPQFNTFMGISNYNATVTDKGHYCTTKEGKQDLFIPFAGHRSSISGSVCNIGHNGYCWLSPSFNKDLGCLFFQGGNGFNPYYYNYRSSGHSVRPVLSN